MVAKARGNLGTMDLVVFPEYALHGLSMDTNPAIMCTTWTGRRSRPSSKACVDNRIWGCFSIMERNPHGYPYNVGLIIDDQGEVKLYYRKMHPWVPVEPWEPGDIGIPVIDGPKGARLALIICHDGMFPEMARECAYKGAEIMIRTAGYTAPIRESLALHQPVQRLLQPDGHRQRVHVRLGRAVRFHGRGHGRQFRRRHHRPRHHAAGSTRSSPPRCGPTSCARRAGIGASRTTSTSSAIAASPPSPAGRGTAPTPT